MRHFLAGLTVLMVLSANVAFAAPTDSATSGTQAAQGTLVGNTHCPIMTEKKVGEKSKTVTHKGQIVRLCCNKCVRKFAENPDDYLKKAQADAKASR